jgi:uncharacterized protein DUF4157
MHDHEEARRKSNAGPKKEATANPSFTSLLGNAGIARLVEGEGIDRSAGGPGRLDREIARAITDRRGRGRELDNDAQAELGSAMGEDFSDVRIHDDAPAHELSKSVSAEAFTTGSDVFFKSGRYDPGSSEGRKLLAHELTHVAQQRGATPASELTVSEPSDAAEVEASEVADRISSAPPSSSAAPATVSRAAEEEELQASRVDRAAAPDEEESLQG